MRTRATIVLLTTVSFTLSAQVPVKKDLMQMFEKLPPPPTTVKDAYAKVITNNDQGVLRCSAEKLFKSIEEHVRGVQADFAAQPKAGPGSAVPGLSPDAAKKMNDPEMKKKMNTMSKEEKMKMAMEMMKSVPTGTPVTEVDPPPVRAALEEWQKIYNDTQNEFQRSVAEQQEEAKLVEEYQKSHSEIDSCEAAEIAKLPQIGSGEMSAPDPVKVKEVRLRSVDKHIAVADKRLVQIRSRWRASLDHAKERYSAFYRKLVAADYAADTKNFSTQKILADAQLMILKNIRHQIDQSRSSWEESASWQSRRVSIVSQ